ncbi:MAG: beta-ketoacyl synthase chain length factor [Pseudomonadales bacterium]|nr:beta-ketoacyl synthase chain length factor [Pseudomonadales bacterium]
MDFCLSSWAVWPIEDHMDSAQSTSDSIPPSADLSWIPAMQRRRLSAFSKAALGVAHQCGINSDMETVFASRHGDLQRTVGLLTDVIQQTELSPTQFGLSVHNATAGLFGMILGNKKASASISAGECTLHYAITEAVARLHSKRLKSIGIIYTDFPVPEIYRSFTHEPRSEIALALTLTPEQGMPVSVLESNATGASSTECEASALRRFLESAEQQCEIVAGTRHWTWIRHAAVTTTGTGVQK